MKAIVSMLTVLFCAFMSFAEVVDLREHDLSGAWRVTANVDGQPTQYDLILLKTTLQPGGDPFYQVIGTFFGADLKGLRVRVRPANGLWHLSWYMFKSPNDENVDGTRLDGEGNMVLEVLDDGNTLVLGGDFETEEGARMTRLTWFDEPTPAM